jgi:hypothetical protein
MAFIAYALPIVPGQSGRAAGFGEEMTPELREQYETLNRHANIRRHMEWVQPSPMGDLLIVVFESETPEKVGREFQNDAYDEWWTSRVKALHGFDPTDPDFHPVMPTMTWDWHNEMATQHG